MKDSLQISRAAARPAVSSASHRMVWAGATAALALVAMGFAGGAHARDNVYWSVGVNSPGVSVGVTNGAPVYVAQTPVYVQPAPVYVQPTPVYVPRPVLIQPRPVYVQPTAVYVQPAPVYQQGWAPPGQAYGWHKKHRHNDRDDRDYGRDYGRGEHSGFYAQNQIVQPYVQAPQIYQRGGYYGR